MAGRIKSYVVDPANVEIEMTFRFSLATWRKLVDQMQPLTVCSWPANEVRQAVLEATAKLEKQLQTSIPEEPK